MILFLAILIGITSIFATGFLLYKQSRDVLPVALPSAEERDLAARKLWEDYPAFPDDEPDTALFLLNEAKLAYESWLESNKSIERKATSLSGFIAGGAGILTVIGALHGSKSAVPFGPFLVLTFIAASCCLIACLYILRPKLRPHPSINEYVSPLIAYSAKSRFHLALSLAEAYNKYTLEVGRLRRFDPAAWTSAQIFLVLAVLSILIHLSLSLASPSTKSVLSCTGQTGAFRTGAALKVSCKEN